MSRAGIRHVVDPEHEDLWLGLLTKRGNRARDGKREYQKGSVYLPSTFLSGGFKFEVQLMQNRER